MSNCKTMKKIRAFKNHKNCSINIKKIYKRETRRQQVYKWKQQGISYQNKINLKKI